MAVQNNPVKGVLKGELGVILGKISSYRKAMLAIPPGSLVEKKIKGKQFFYRAYRDGRKVRFAYVGKLSQEGQEKARKAASMRMRYRKIISDLKKQAIYLRRVLHERKRRPG